MALLALANREDSMRRSLALQLQIMLLCLLSLVLQQMKVRGLDCRVLGLQTLSTMVRGHQFVKIRVLHLGFWLLNRTSGLRVLHQTLTFQPGAK
jgi:hypothetical protein